MHALGLSSLVSLISGASYLGGPFHHIYFSDHTAPYITIENVWKDPLAVIDIMCVIPPGGLHAVEHHVDWMWLMAFQQ